MPVNAFSRDCDFGHQVCARKGDALRREAAQRDVADNPVFFGDLLRIEEAAELLGLLVGGHGRRQSHPKPLSASALYTRPRARPCALTAMAIVALRRGAVEADLQRDAITGERAERFEPACREQHAVGEHRRRRGYGARSQDFGDVREQERLAASYKDFADTELRGFASDPLHTREAERPPGCGGRRAHTAIVAT